MTIIAFVAAQLADIWTTKKGIENGAVEKNGIIKWLMDTFGEHGWWITKLLFSAVIVAALIWAGQLVWLWGGTALTAYVAWRNMRFLK